MINWEDIETNKTSGVTKTTCPSCSHTRKKKKDPCLYVNLDSGVAKCYNCEELSFRDTKEVRKKSYDLPKQEWSNFTKLSDKMVKYFKSRGLSQKTLMECGITEETYFQPAKGKELNNIVFNYFEGDTVVNKKYRSSTKDFTQTKNSKNIFYGVNDIIGEKECYVVEGEIDKLSFWEIGKKNCISVPNGANDNDDYWENSKSYLESIETFLIATDMDEKGEQLSEKIAQRLGRWKCKRIQFKNKDANEDLKESVLTLEESLDNIREYPVAGTLRVSDFKEGIQGLYDNGIPKTLYPMNNGLDGLKNIWTTMRGHLVVGTGIPSHGKSTFTEWYVLNLIAEHEMKVSFLSPEHSPYELHQANLMQQFYGRPFFKGKNGVERITQSEINEYIDWANERIYTTMPDKGKSITWDFVFETFQSQMYSYGVDIFVIDAYNKVLHDKQGTPKQLADEVLTKLTSFAQINNALIFLIAHPTKMKKNQDGVYDVPDLYDVSGSADFRNQTHDGFSIYRDFDTETTDFYNLKTKYGFQGKMGEKHSFVWDDCSGRYYPLGRPFNRNPLINLKPKTIQANMGFEMKTGADPF